MGLETLLKQKPPIDWKRRIAVIRLVKGWSRRDLGDAIGSSGRTVEAWELGRYKPDKRARRVLRAIWIEVREAEVPGEDEGGGKTHGG